MTKIKLLRQREAKAFQNLLRWQAKLKAAARKVDRLLKQVHRYRKLGISAQQKRAERKAALEIQRHIILEDEQ